MKYFHIFSTLIRNKVQFSRSLTAMRTICGINYFTLPVRCSQTFIHKVSRKYLHDNEEFFDDFSFEEIEIEQTRSDRNILFKNYEDDVIAKLNSSVSIEEVLNIVSEYRNVFEDKHIAQTVLILSDLQKIYHKYTGVSDTKSNTFLENISKNEGFDILLECLTCHLKHFNPEYLSYVLFFLNTLGVSIETQLMQDISLQVRDNLLKKFCLAQCSRFLKVIFYENSVRPYYLSLNIIPLVANQIEKCDSVQDLHNLSICLNKLHNVVTTEILERYKMKVTEFLKDKKLKGTDYETLLKIMLFLNFPKWRDKCILLISDCILLMKNEINLLNIENLTILYQIFYKNQEPGVMLNNIQRCSAKFLHQLDESEMGDVLSLKMFSSLIFFSSPTHRIRFQKDIPKYLKNCKDYKSLVELRKIFSYVKVSDLKLCDEYWNVCLKLFNENANTSLLLKLCQDYINFNISVNNYRNPTFEKTILDYLTKSLSTDSILNPTKILCYLNFVLRFGTDESLLKLLLNKVEENPSRFRVSDCMKISHSLLHLNNTRDRCISQEQINKIKILLNYYTKEMQQIEENSSENNIMQSGLLIKASILRNNFDTENMEYLLLKYKELDYMSSKIIENISYIFLATGSLLPEVINKCTEYVINHENNIVGFNAEKLLYLCFFLAYYPINKNKFFRVITDIIIRDQERMSGLAFLQSALALCFFGKLPGSFIRQIFNVEFLEKLDVELENCYAKEKYPQRVRDVLMMLNRAVCLEYPEYNVPWFHKKYIESPDKKSVDDDSKFQERVREYLMRVLRTRHDFSENVITPYGYHIHFVINFNDKGEVISPDSPEINRRVALLLMKSKAYTRFYKHLKGKVQMKIKHLEIFGYEVAIIKFDEWINLLYGEEHLEYLSKLIWPTDKIYKVGVRWR